MTTTQLAIVVPAVAVIAVAAINAWWQVRVNQQAIESQRRLAVQARIVTTYEDMLEMVGWQMEVVDTTKPIFSMDKPPEPPPMPENEHIRKVQARIGVHGSKDAKSILERWAKKRSEFFAAAWYLDTMQNDQAVTDVKANYDITLSDQWRKVEGGRAALHGIVRELEDAVSAELRA